MDSVSAMQRLSPLSFVSSLSPLILLWGKRLKTNQSSCPLPAASADTHNSPTFLWEKPARPTQRQCLSSSSPSQSFRSLSTLSPFFISLLLYFARLSTFLFFFRPSFSPSLSFSSLASRLCRCPPLSPLLQSLDYKKRCRRDIY